MTRYSTAKKIVYLNPDKYLLLKYNYKKLKLHIKSQKYNYPNPEIIINEDIISLLKNRYITKRWQ